MTTLIEAMSRLLASGAGADVNLLVGEKQLKAHRLILVTRSPVFAAMFQNDTAEAASGCIIIEDVEADTMEQLLAYIYTDEVPVLEDVAGNLLVAADKYDLPLLKEACEDHLVKSLSLDDVAECAVLALRHGCSRLQAAAIALISRNLREASNTEGWREGMDCCPQLMKEVSQLVSVVKMRQAAEYGHMETLKEILATGTDVNAQCEKGYTALHKAVRGGHVPAVTLLLESGADVDARNAWQQTPLHIAAGFGRKDAAFLLLFYGADKDARDRNDETALQIAAQCGEATVVAALMRVGADTTVGSCCGRTPLDLARLYKRWVCADILRGIRYNR